MSGRLRTLTWTTCFCLGLAASGHAQTFQPVGTRAQGMGGAFVGVADDASAVYWNPGGLARGAYFSLLLDSGTSDSIPNDRQAGKQSGWLLALGTPALGVSYYRLKMSAVNPSAQDPDLFSLTSLVTHHAGLTVVQSLTDGIAVGVTGKLIRGVAAEGATFATRAEDVLDDFDVIGRSANRFDLDVGIMATGSFGSVGLTVRNVTEPSFETADDVELELERQIRGGASVLLLPTWKLAADIDFTTAAGPLGEVREFALGTEAAVTKRLTARGGFRLNTAGDRGRTPAFSVGGSFAVMGSAYLDAQVTAGSDDAFRGWGVAGRILF